MKCLAFQNMNYMLIGILNNSRKIQLQHWVIKVSKEKKLNIRPA